MRTFKTDGLELEIRPMKRKEIKALKKKGFDLRKIESEKIDETMDAVFDVLFTKDELKEIDGLEEKIVFHKLWPEVMKETFSSPDEEKNSETPGDSIPTATE
jgi:protein-tyrosine-phosphatase